MAYELVKKLKDAGFPNSKDWIDRPELGTFESADTYSVPTLSELGDALPDGFSSGRYLQIGTGTSSDAEIRYFAVYDPTPFEGDPLPQIRMTGATEEEARAKLWLELNKK